ncbi:MAG: NAD(P)-dependent oxidoreductase [Hyphomonas sp.]|nr:NAD(P)-dependent oxidoreductase [Hyphomonas sp.]
MTQDDLKPKLGLLGIGQMGGVFARHFIDAGWDVIGWDRRPEPLEELEAYGGTAAKGFSDFHDVGIVISVLFDDAATREVFLEGDALIESLADNTLHIVMASISPDFSSELAQAHRNRDQRYLAASVFGRPEAAAAAQLQINCSGDRESFDEAESLLNILGTSRWIGDGPELAMLVKCLGNSMITASVEMVREMFTLLAAAGIKEQLTKEMLIDTLFACPIFSGYSQIYMNDPGSAKMTPIARKDRQTCLDAASKLHIELPLVQHLHEKDLP